MTIRRRIAIGLAWMFAGNWAEQAANLLVFVLLARILGPEAFGLAAMATVFVLLAEFLVRETVTETILQLPEVEDGHLDAVFWLLGALSVGVVVSIWILAGPIAAVFDEPRVADYVLWAAPTVLFIGFSGVPVARLRRDLDFRVLAMRATAGVLVGGVVGLTMAWSGFGALSLIAQRVAQVFVNNVLAWAASPWRPGLRATRRHLWDVVGFSSRMVGLRAAELVSLNAPTVVIGAFLGPVALGQYTVAWRLIEIATFVLVAPVRYVAQSGFAHLNRRDGSAGRLLQDVMDAASLIVLPSFVGLATVGGLAMPLTFGEAFAPAVPALQWLCLVGVYLSIERLQSSFCIALGRAGRLLAASIVEAVLGIAAMGLAVDQGLVGVAAAFAVAYCVVWPYRILVVTGLAGLRPGPYLGRFALPALWAFVMALAVVVWQRSIATDWPGVLRLVGACAVGAAVYGSGVWLTMSGRVRDTIASFRAVEEVGGVDDGR